MVALATFLLDWLFTSMVGMTRKVVVKLTWVLVRYTSFAGTSARRGCRT
jgi:hypothetical protein